MSKHAKLTEDTLLELLRQRADRYADKVAFAFSYNGDGENTSVLTYRDLDTRARAIAAELQSKGAAGERVLVLLTDGVNTAAGGGESAGGALGVEGPAGEHAVALLLGERGAGDGVADVALDLALARGDYERLGQDGQHLHDPSERGPEGPSHQPGREQREDGQCTQQDEGGQPRHHRRLVRVEAAAGQGTEEDDERLTADDGGEHPPHELALRARLLV